MDTYIVSVQDTVIQGRDYVVIAMSPENAFDLVKNGHYLVESSATTLDFIETSVVRTEKLDPNEFKALPAQVGNAPVMSAVLEEILDIENAWYKAQALRKLVEELKKAGK